VAILKREPLAPRLGKGGLCAVQRFGKAVRQQPHHQRGVPVPNETQLFDTTARFPELITAIENFANFQRFLNQPTPVPSFSLARSRRRQWP
jgi:hypothetical protein